jgi:hypothetical protein
MGEVVDEVRALGHDVQLHVHPCWGALSGRKAGTIAAGDYTDWITDFSGQALTDLLGQASEVFRRLTGSPPLAFRSGSLVAHRELFSALAEVNIRLSSTLCLGVFEPVEPELQVPWGLCRIDGVTEAPVTSFQSLRLPGHSNWKAATVIGTSWSEQKSILDQACRRNQGPVVVLTHASEYSRDAGTCENRSYTPAPLVQRRLDRLCRYVAENPRRFTAVTFRERHGDWTSSNLGVGGAAPLRTGLLGLGQRLIENNLLPRLGIH